MRRTGTPPLLLGAVAAILLAAASLPAAAFPALPASVHPAGRPVCNAPSLPGTWVRHPRRTCAGYDPRPDDARSHAAVRGQDLGIARPGVFHRNEPGISPARASRPSPSCGAGPGRAARRSRWAHQRGRASRRGLCVVRGRSGHRNRARSCLLGHTHPPGRPLRARRQLPRPLRRGHARGAHGDLTGRTGIQARRSEACHCLSRCR